MPRLPGRPAALLLALWLGGCAGSGTPPGSVPRPASGAVNVEERAQTVRTLAELLVATIPGLSLVQMEGSQAVQFYGARGVPVIVVDGLRQPLGSPLPPLEPREVVTVRGSRTLADGTLYGRDATAGIIEITTRRTHASSP